MTSIHRLLYYVDAHAKNGSVGKYITRSSQDIDFFANSATSIGYYAFYGCSGLTSITVNNNNPDNISLGNDVFKYVHTITCTLYVPKGSKELYAAAGQWKEFANIVEFEGDASVESIEADMQTEDIYYDLMGRRMANPSHGIYIKNGKKVLVK